jgi:hypothetical protein
VAALLAVLSVLGGCTKGGDAAAETPIQTDAATQPPVQAPTQAPTAEPAKEAAITEGVYALAGSTEGVPMPTHIKFKEDGTYYGKYFSGGVVDAGTYELADGAIILTSYKGGAVSTFPFVDDVITDATLGGMMEHARLEHDPDYSYDPSVDEISIVVEVFYADNNDGLSVTLYHDRTFVDYTGDVGDEGAWDKNGDGRYTLTNERGAVYTLVINGKDAVYTKNGTEVALCSEIESDEALAGTFAAAGVSVGLPMPVDIRIDCLADGTAKLIVAVAEVGAEMVADEGTYTVADVFNFTFIFNLAGEIAGEPDYASATPSSIVVNVPYKGSVTVDFSGSQIPLDIVAVLTGTFGG